MGLERRSFRTKREAEEYASREAERARQGKGTHKEARKTTVADLHARWRTSFLAAIMAGRRKEKTLHDHDSVWRVHVEPAWAGTPIVDIRRSHLRNWIDEQLEEGAAPSGIRKALGLLSLLFKRAMDEDLVEANPTVQLEVTEPIAREPVILTPTEVEHLAQECAPYTALVRSLAYVGWRYSEATSLRIEDVDLNAHRARIWQTDSGGSTKTRRSRTVALPKIVVEDMRPLIAGRAGEERVYTTPRGGRIWVQVFHQHHFDPAREKIGYPQLRAHDLRHFAITTMMAAGVPLPTVQAQVGHTTGKMILEVYAHVRSEDLTVAAEAMENLVFTKCLPPANDY